MLYFLYKMVGVLNIRPPILHNFLKLVIWKFRGFFCKSSTFDVNGLSGTSCNLLWIFESKTILPKLVAFLCSIVKYFSCFSVILRFCLRPLKMALLFSVRFCWILYLNLTLLWTVTSFNCFLIYKPFFKTIFYC